ncbi:hypothetical protein T484DRAFT_1962694 [Baffinella frigidus]|nr:hypothetical protein T484DRAFT_1962694 [Cryptophyta sp. CCMP2293]
MSPCRPVGTAGRRGSAPPHVKRPPGPPTRRFARSPPGSSGSVRNSHKETRSKEGSASPSWAWQKKTSSPGLSRRMTPSSTPST